MAPMLAAMWASGAPVIALLLVGLGGAVMATVCALAERDGTDGRFSSHDQGMCPASAAPYDN